MRREVGSRRVRRARRAVSPVGFVVILVAAMVALVGPAGARPGAGDPRLAEITTNHARLAADAFDGEGTSADSDSRDATDFSAFSESVTAADLPFDPTEDRTASANASQNTTVDSSDPDVTRVSSVGVVGASWGDQNPGDGQDPSAEATSEFSVTFEVTDAATFFSLSGALSAEGDGASVECTTVTVTSPTGAVFEVATPSDCGAPSGLSIQEGGKLEPGTYTFSVLANAQALNPDALGGTSAASFNVDLDLGCSITGTPNADTLSGTAEDDFICGLGGDDILDGSGGDDVIFGGGGSDRITGGEGNDAIAGEGGEDGPISVSGAGLFGGPGDDHIDGGEGFSYIEGGTGNDMLGGGSDNDVIFGDDQQGCEGALSDPGLDDDEIFGGGGPDFLTGCQGLDKISGEGGDDAIDGNTGNDVLRGGAGSDKVHGNDGSDKLTGGTRKDVLAGDGGDDTLLANDGVLDVVRGGPGGGDEAKIDENIDTVTGVEVFL